MTLFTPITGFIGGSLIGAAAGSLLLFNGDILGWSGFISSALLDPVKTLKETPWKVTFLASFCLATTTYMRYVDPNRLADSGGPSKLAFALGGLLVGFGTTLGNGCTSGHGICGLARFSKRSFVNVLSFMSTGMLTSCLMSSMEGNNLLRTMETNPIHSQYGMLFSMAIILAALPNLSDKKTLGAALSGTFGACGLAIGGIVSWATIQAFLTVSTLWKDPLQYDPTVMCVMGSGVIVSWISYQFLPNYSITKSPETCMKKPLENDAFHVPTNTAIDWKLIGGGAVFGVGWSVGCLCPGAALFNVAAGSEGAMFCWFPCFVGGAYLAQRLAEYSNYKDKAKTT